MLLLFHVPPPVALLNTVVVPAHTAVAPVIAAGAVLTVNGIVV
jgi:hypothetical protein